MEDDEKEIMESAKHDAKFQKHKNKKEMVMMIIYRHESMSDLKILSIHYGMKDLELKLKKNLNGVGLCTVKGSGHGINTYACTVLFLLD